MKICRTKITSTNRGKQFASLISLLTNGRISIIIELTIKIINRTTSKKAMRNRGLQDLRRALIGAIIIIPLIFIQEKCKGKISEEKPLPEAVGALHPLTRISPTHTPNEWPTDATARSTHI